jgi:antitoxin CptB
LIANLRDLNPIWSNPMSSSQSQNAHQSNSTQRTRLRWRGRRGLLENDLILTRFFDQREASLSDDDVIGLDALLDLPDNDLLDLILSRTELPESAEPQVAKVLGYLRLA